MGSLVRSKPVLSLFPLTLVALVSLSLAVSMLHPAPAHAATAQFAQQGELDCNGYSLVQQPVKRNFPCADMTGLHGERGEDNDHYIGHDEPSTQFLSSQRGSGN